jgi:hypothetical protein
MHPISMIGRHWGEKLQLPSQLDGG